MVPLLLLTTNGIVCVCVGSGSSYLYGFFDQAWKDNMTKEEAEVTRFTSLYLHMQKSHKPHLYNWSLLLYLRLCIYIAATCCEGGFTSHRPWWSQWWCRTDCHSKIFLWPEARWSETYV